MGFVFNPTSLLLAVGGVYLIVQENLFWGGICIAAAIVASISDSISDAASRKDEASREILKRLEHIEEQLSEIEEAVHREEHQEFI
jgi:hypothetical protein